MNIEDKLKDYLDRCNKNHGFAMIEGREVQGMLDEIKHLEMKLNVSYCDGYDAGFMDGFADAEAMYKEGSES